MHPIPVTCLYPLRKKCFSHWESQWDCSNNLRSQWGLGQEPHWRIKNLIKQPHWESRTSSRTSVKNQDLGWRPPYEILIEILNEVLPKILIFYEVLDEVLDSQWGFWWGSWVSLNEVFDQVFDSQCHDVLAQDIISFGTIVIEILNEKNKTFVRKAMKLCGQFTLTLPCLYIHLGLLYRLTPLNIAKYYTQSIHQADQSIQCHGGLSKFMVTGCSSRRSNPDLGTRDTMRLRSFAQSLYSDSLEFPLGAVDWVSEQLNTEEL